MEPRPALSSGSRRLRCSWGRGVGAGQRISADGGAAPSSHVRQEHARRSPHREARAVSAVGAVRCRLCGRARGVRGIELPFASHAPRVLIHRDARVEIPLATAEASRGRRSAVDRVDHLAHIDDVVHLAHAGTVVRNATALPRPRHDGWHLHPQRRWSDRHWEDGPAGGIKAALRRGHGGVGQGVRLLPRLLHRVSACLSRRRRDWLMKA